MAHSGKGGAANALFWRVRALASSFDMLLIIKKPAMWLTQSHKVTVVGLSWALLLVSIAGAFLPLRQQERRDCCYHAGDHLARNRFIDRDGERGPTVVAFDGKHVFQYVMSASITGDSPRYGLIKRSALRDIDVVRRNDEVYARRSGEFLGEVVAEGRAVLDRYNFEIGELDDEPPVRQRPGYVMIYGTQKLDTSDVYVVFWLGLVVSAGMVARWSWIQARSLRALPFSSSLWISPLLLYCCTMLCMGPFWALLIYFDRAASGPYAYTNPLTARHGVMIALVVVCLLHIVCYIMAAYGVGLRRTNVVLVIILLSAFGYISGWGVGGAVGAVERAAAIAIPLIGSFSLIVALLWPVRRRSGRFIASSAMAVFLLIGPSMAMWVWQFDRLASGGMSDPSGPTKIAMLTTIGFLGISYALERRILFLRAAPLTTTARWRWRNRPRPGISLES